MMKRIAGLVAIAVIASQALMGSAFALTSVTHNGLGDPYSGRAPADDCDLERGLASASDSLHLRIYGSKLVCAVGGDSDDFDLAGDTVQLSAIRQPLEVVAGGNVTIWLHNGETDYPVDFRGLNIELEIGGTLVFEGDAISPDTGERGARLTVTNTGVTGHGLQNLDILNAATVQFYGSGYDDFFDASAVTTDITGEGTELDEAGIYGDYGNDTLKGGSGHDVIDGYDDDDTVFGNAGDDVLYGGDENDKVFGGEGEDWIDCTADDETDQCWGNTGDDTIYVNGDADSVAITVAPGDGADELQFDDYDGSVTLYYGDTTKGQSVTLTDDCRTSDFGEDFAAPTYEDCEAITTIVGSPKDDVFDVSDLDTSGSGRGATAFAAIGGAGNDILVGGDSVYFSGGSGEDALFGGSEVVMLGGADNDKIVADGGHLLAGGSGNDLVRGQGVKNGGPGNDRIFGGTGFGYDWVYAGKGNDLVYTYGYNDSIHLGQGNDRASAGEGDDQVWGGPGNDQIHGDGDDDELYGDAGTDRVWGDTDNWNNDYSYTLDDGDMCEGEITAECEWVSAVGPAGPYWVRLA